MTSGGNDVNDFVIINLPNFVQFKQYYGKILSMVKGLGGCPPANSPGNYAYGNRCGRAGIIVHRGNLSVWLLVLYL